MKKILLAFPIVLILAAGCNKSPSVAVSNGSTTSAQQQESSTSPNNQTPTVKSPSSNQSQNTNMNNLQSQLESTYNQMRTALQNKDLNGFLAVMPVPAGSPTPTASQFSQAATAMLTQFPDLSQTQFIKVDQKGDSAGYYYQTDLNNPNFVSISMVKFQKVNGDWTISASGSFGSSFPKNGSKTIDSELQSNPGFQL
jgi:hypothetical protein